MLVSDFVEGDMARALNDANAKSGFYHLIWSRDGIKINEICPADAELIYKTYLSFVLEKQSKPTVAPLIIKSTDAKVDDNNFYLGIWINEKGVARALHFLTLEEDNARRFVKGWHKYVEK